MNSATDQDCGGEPATGTYQVDVWGRLTAAVDTLPSASRQRPADSDAPTRSMTPRPVRLAVGRTPALPIRSSAPQRLDLSVIPAVRLPIQRWQDIEHL